MKATVRKSGNLEFEDPVSDDISPLEVHTHVIEFENAESDMPSDVNSVLKTEDVVLEDSKAWEGEVLKVAAHEVEEKN